MLLTRLVVPAGTPGFAGEQPKAVLWTGERPAQRFRNAVRDLTIEIGAGNPRAIGMQFNASNQGTIRNVILRAAADSGQVGLDMGFTDEIGPLLVRRLMVEGFETGISTKWPVNSNTFEQVLLRGQRKLGWHNYQQMIFVRGLRSENAVTTLYNEKDSMGTVTLVDSRITGLSGEGPVRGRVRRIIGLEGRFFSEGKAVWRLVDGGAEDAPVVVVERMTNRSGGQVVELSHESKRTLVVSSATGFVVEGRGSGDVFLEDLCGQLNLQKPGQSAWCRQLNVEHRGTMCRNNGGRLWILGMKTEKIGTIIETVNGGITDAAGIFLYSNEGWQEGLPAFVIENSTAMLCGINERNFNRKPVGLWVRETQGGETRETVNLPWVYLSK